MDRLSYLVTVEENMEDIPENWTLLSLEDGIAKYESFSCDNMHKYIHGDTKTIPCHLLPDSVYEASEYHLYVHISALSKPGSGWALESTDGEWEHYTMIKCSDIHKLLAENNAAIAKIYAAMGIPAPEE